MRPCGAGDRVLSMWVRLAPQQQVEPVVQYLAQVLAWLLAGQPAAEGVEIDGGEKLRRYLRVGRSVIGGILPNYAGYAASKAAVEAMTFILAHELRGRDVTVNAVAPGPTATDMFPQGKDEAALARFAGAVRLERLGTPADIASVVAFLASPAGHWINGQTIRVNGGIN